MVIADDIIMIKLGNTRTAVEPGGPKTGLFRATVAAFNPSREELSRLFGKPYHKEKIYLSKTEEGEARVNMEIWLKEVRTDELFPLRFSIVEKLRRSDKTGLYQWINEAGMTVYAKDREEIESTPDTADNWRMVEFRKWKYRGAMVGEETLAEFLVTLLLQGAKPDRDTIIAPDMRKIFKGDFSELNRDVKAVAANSEITALATISPHKSGKSFQNVYRSVAPGFFYDRIKKNTLTPAISYWLSEIEGPFGPRKDHYSLDNFLSD